MRFKCFILVAAVIFLAVSINTLAQQEPVIEEFNCPENMEKIIVHQIVSEKRIKKEFCVDSYEYPNIAGKSPMTDVTWLQAKKLCTTVGKHLCSDFEWMESCQSPKRNNYPYGSTFEKSKCNVNSSVPNKIGENSECVSYYNIYDLAGNVEEWTAGKGIGTSGGNFDDGESAKCTKWRAQSIPKKHKTIGFRCCYSLEDQKFDPGASNEKTTP
ncbi:MAG: SUMF1/EgtB/PvdO family nonheme iron enzyme [bacterium]